MTLQVKDSSSREVSHLAPGVLVNAAGLQAQEVASRLKGLPSQHVPKRHLARGCYFSLVGWSQRLCLSLLQLWLGMASSSTNLVSCAECKMCTIASSNTLPATPFLDALESVISAFAVLRRLLCLLGTGNFIRQ